MPAHSQPVPYFPDPLPSCRTLGLANRPGPGQDDVTALLRNIADMIDRLPPSTILDVVISGNEVTEHGPWWKAVVYFATDSDEASS
ncbi:hypothetical protein GCM10028772_42820 [Nocardioides ultimimeridianus]